eukprot:1656089-Rhodomonas_salina.1
MPLAVIKYLSPSLRPWLASSYRCSTNSTSAARGQRRGRFQKLLNAASCLMMSSHELAADQPQPPRESA